MRAHPALSPARKGKRRLLESCAITAGLVALAYGGPAMAQGVVGTGVITTGGVGGSITDSANKTTVTITSNEAIVNWTPSGTPTDGVIDFLPVGNTLEFRGGLGGYTVLNRFVSGTGTSISDTIALSGTVQSFRTAAGVPDAQGGNIWFYNAGGILINSGAAINVGSLVLTTNDIDTTGGLAPGGTIRFRGAPNSNATVTVANNAFIGADNGVAGGSYVALVAPRVVQNGIVNVNGSAAYVAAEVADITINAANGLFDINVTTGANGGNVIAHGGVTTGPEQTGALAHRVYMVAIPKNDAVTMLVSGQVGYDDASSATVSNGSIVLSAGYNVTAGAMNETPANNTAANISVNDIIFLSDVTAHASNDFLGQPLGVVPTGGPFTVLPPAWQGRFSIQGNGTFVGENSATLAINAGRQSIVTGDLLVQANGTAAGPGSATITVDGGGLVALGNINLLATGAPNGTTGIGQGGSATLNVLNGGQMGAGVDLTVSADGFGGFDDGGEGGSGTGGTAAINVSGTGSLLIGDTISASADGLGGALALDAVTGNAIVADNGGDGIGGNAAISVSGGAQLTATVGVVASAAGRGRVGLDQSGNGTGGDARIQVTGAGTSFTAPQTTVNAAGVGGGSISDAIYGTVLSANGGDGVGNAALLSFGTDTGSSVSAGAVSVNASGTGGGANGDGAAGGNAVGGGILVEANGSGTVALSQLTIDASANSGGASSASSGGNTARSGDAQGGTALLRTSNVSTLAISTGLSIDVSGRAVSSENVGSGTGGGASLSAIESSTISVGDTIDVTAFGGSQSSAIPVVAGSGTGGTVDLLADLSGTISASNYSLDASASVVNVSGTNGPAQGGFITMTALNGGLIRATNDGVDQLNVSAQTGVSTAGSSATGGSITIFANEADMQFSNPVFSASGGSGGATDPNATGVVGIGGLIQIGTGFDPAHGIDLGGGLNADADGRTFVDVEAAPGLPRDTSGDGQGGTIDVQVSGGSLTGGSLFLTANGYGGASGSNSTGRGGAVTFTQIGGDTSLGDVTLNADGIGGDFAGPAGGGVSGDGIGGNTSLEITGGTFTASDVSLSASGQGGRGFDGDDFDFLNPTAAGDGGNGQGGGAGISIADTAVVNTTVLAAYASGRGGDGGDYRTVGSVPGNGGNAGFGSGGNATISLNGGELVSDAVTVDASGFGGAGGSAFLSSSSGPSTSVGTGGRGGDAFGGFATIGLGPTLVNISESITTYSTASGGVGGSGTGGGGGGNASGGVAQVLVDDFDAGELSIALDGSATGGNGGIGYDGAGGNGGSARGGTTAVEARGPNGNVIVSQSNFVSVATGGTGGSAFTDFFSTPEVAGRGGDGGEGIGGEISIVATDGGTVGLGIGGTGGGTLSSVGNGGDGGRGADNPNTIRQPGPDGMLFTADDTFLGLTGGNGGFGGAGTGGTVALLARGGTITSDGAPVDISVSGISGNGGDGGVGSGGTGSCCTSFVDLGGRVVFRSETTEAGAGQISLGDTTIAANGFIAGRIELRSSSSISLASLDANAAGFAQPTNNDTDLSAYGVFFAANGGSIEVADDLTVQTGGSFGAYAQGGGQVRAGDLFQINAADQVDILHDMRGASEERTLFAGGDLSITAGTTIRGATGSLLAGSGVVTLTALGTTGRIDVDHVEGGTVVMSSTGATSVEHAEADDDFTASAGSFRTGLNSIITGGDISITSPGAVDLGNSSAGGFVSATGESIVFTNIDAGQTVDLTANGTVAGAEGIRGGSIDAGGTITLFGNSIALGGNVTGTGSFFAFGTGGNVAVNQADVDGTVSVFADGNLTGNYAAGGDVLLNANGDVTVSASAAGTYVDPNGIGTNGNVYIDAAGNVTLTGGAAARMLGINAGGSASVGAASAGEDVLVVAGTTASLNDVSAGDDVNVRALGAIDAVNVRTTGTGPDNAFLNYTPPASSGFGGFTITVGEGSSATDGSDIVLSSGSNIDATTLSAGDDIIALASGTIGLSGATTLGLGVTTGGSNIRTQGGDTSVTGLDAFDDVLIDAAGAASADGVVNAGRDIVINADSIGIAELTQPGGTPVPTLVADGTISLASANAIEGGSLFTQGDVNLDAGTFVDLAGTASGGNTVISAAEDLSVRRLDSIGTTTLLATGGAIDIGALFSAGEIDAQGDTINVAGGGDMIFANLVTDVGDASLVSSGDLFVQNGSIAGRATLRGTGERVGVDALTADSASIEATGGFVTLNSVSVTDDLTATARGSLLISGIVTGRSISLGSSDITIDTAARVGTAGTTEALSVMNTDDQRQTFVGGTGTRNGYHIDAAELARLFGSDMVIFAPEVGAVSQQSVGSSAPPDVIVDSFTLAGGAAGSNLGAGGSLTIRTPGKMRVIGNVQLTGLSDTNALNLFADEALEVILGQGTVRLLGANNAPGGQLNMASEDIIVATTAAIADVANASSMAAINTRLGQNDGVTIDEGALFARGIRFNVIGGVYVQNSGTGTDFGLRRGLTFGAGGLDVLTEGPSSRIVLNGVQLGASGQVTGLDTLQFLTVAGVPANTATGSYDPESTLNGCFISNVASCTTVRIDFDNNFPVQDVIEDEVGDGSEDEGDGTSLPTALITMRDLDPLTGEPLLDDPVTGAGNDDLWTPAPDTQQP
ncbi:hypothetical protein ATE69_19190 [Sphingopyxis sp. H071]|nr:hypothetical protein [Sphingopyxis sp. H071]KTE49924.1 hypothetical protein ATE69_19190 [Sphingopyxis sp. H071]